jgi:hypothetical protein
MLISYVGIYLWCGHLCSCNTSTSAHGVGVLISIVLELNSLLGLPIISICSSNYKWPNLVEYL